MNIKARFTRIDFPPFAVHGPAPLSGRRAPLCWRRYAVYTTARRKSRLLTPVASLHSSWTHRTTCSTSMLCPAQFCENAWWLQLRRHTSDRRIWWRSGRGEWKRKQIWQWYPQGFCWVLHDRRGVSSVAVEKVNKTMMTYRSDMLTSCITYIIYRSFIWITS